MAQARDMLHSMTEPTERDMIRSKVIAEYGTPTSSAVASAAVNVFRHQAWRISDLPSEQTFTAADVAAAREQGRREAIEEVLEILGDEGWLGHARDRVQSLLIKDKSK
jgi:hypothetical protein